MLLSDRDIRARCVDVADPMIVPFHEEDTPPGKISSGLCAAGYDMRLGHEFLVFKNTHGEPVDPKRFKDDAYADRMFDRILLLEGQKFYLPSGGYVLARSIERFSIPPDLKGRICGKSTYARCMIFVNVTPAEPGWKGHLTIEIGNLGPSTAILYPGEGIAQIEFEQLSSEPVKDYVRRGGKYMDQVGVTAARIR